MVVVVAEPKCPRVNRGGPGTPRNPFWQRERSLFKTRPIDTTPHAIYLYTMLYRVVPQASRPSALLVSSINRVQVQRRRQLKQTADDEENRKPNRGGGGTGGSEKQRQSKPRCGVLYMPAKRRSEICSIHAVLSQALCPPSLLVLPFCWLLLRLSPALGALNIRVLGFNVKALQDKSCTWLGEIIMHKTSIRISLSLALLLLLSFLVNGIRNP